MKNTVEFLDAVRTKHGLTSDYQLALKLGCSRQAISKFRLGKDKLGDETACKVAELLDLDAGYVLACIAAERAQKPEVKAAWTHTAEMLFGLAAFLSVVAILPTAALPWDGFNLAFAGFAAGDVCILCQTAILYWPILLPLAVLAFWLRPRT